MRKRKNARNVVVVTGHLVIKFPIDMNLGRLFKEFALSWKAFLNGLSPPVILLGPFLIRPAVRLFLKKRDREEVLRWAPKIEEAIVRLSKARIEHREVRHPENHIGIWRVKIVFIDFDHGRIAEKSRDLNKFRAWVEGVRRALYRAGE